MQTQRNFHLVKLVIAGALAAGLVTGCGKKAEEEPVQPAKPASTTTKPTATATKPSVANPKPVTSTATTTGIQPSKPSPLAALAHKAETPITAAEIATLEASYRAKPEFSDRVKIIYQLSEAATGEAIVSLGRLFQVEPDPDLRIEMLDTLFDIDGQDDRKAALLAAGAAHNQPKEVRESAIDNLIDIEPQQALPILRAMLNDPDAEIREQAKDAIEQVEADMAAKVR